MLQAMHLGVYLAVAHNSNIDDCPLRLRARLKVGWLRYDRVHGPAQDTGRTQGASRPASKYTGEVVYIYGVRCRLRD